MQYPKVLKDAENIEIKKNYVTEIGSKIDKNKLPKYQFMGIIKLKKKTFIRCYKFFKELKNNKIDMTTFLYLCLKNKVMKLEIKKYNSYWYEIDTISDYKFAKKDFKKW